MNYAKKTDRDAFTLMEVMLAVIIIGVLATIAVPGVMRMMKMLELNRTKSEMAAIEVGLQNYRNDVGHFPTRQEGGLEAIVQRPGGEIGKKWDGPYLKGKIELPQDAWGYDFEFNLGQQNIQNKNRFKYYEIISYGPEGPDNEADNIYMGE